MSARARTIQHNTWFRLDAMTNLGPASGPYKVFISYRRSDAAGHSRELHRELSRRFDENFAFFDRAGIDVGDDFPERLKNAVEGCVVALVTMGPGWLDARAVDGLRRLDDPADFVRIEVALALVHGKVVIPVLLDDASMPSAHELPGPLKALARCDAFVLRGKAYEYERQLEDLVKQLAQRTGVAPRRENLGIAIDVGDSVALYRNVEYLPVRLRAPLRDAFRPLIEDRQRYFGGRRSAIDSLMAFIGGPHAGYCVVSAPAGFGKTALSASLVVGAGGSIAFHFFTPLYGQETLSEAFFLKSVLEQMAALHGEVWELPPTLDELRAAYQRAIDSPLAGTGVLVLDGIDEVRGWSLAPYLSRTLQTGLRVIVTVRDVGQNWRGEYRFPPAQLLHVELDGLDRAGVGAVLSAVAGMGAELGQGERMRDAVFALAGGDDRQSRGADPFYVRFLAEDLDAGRLTAANLAAAPRGLEAYLDQWWREIRELAGDAPVRDLFGMLTVAAGALTRTELEALQPSLVDEWLADRFEEVLAKVRRVVVRDAAGGYSLIHPRLREFMLRRVRIEGYRERLLAYCRDWRSGSHYALGHVGLHLAEADDWSALRALVATESGGREFLQRRYSVEGSHAGYLRDVERMWQHAEQETRSGTGPLADVMRCALVASSLRSMAGRLVPGLVAAAVRHGQWHVSAALEHASEMPDPVLRASAFGALLPWMSELQRVRACESIVAAVHAMRPDVRRPPVIVIEGPAPPVRDVDRRGDALKPLAKVMPEGLVDVVLPIVRSLDRPDQIPILLAALACAVPRPKRQALADEAFSAVERIKPRSLIYNRMAMAVPLPVRKARSLVAMAEYLDDPQRADAHHMALRHALQAPRGRSVDTLVELLPKWSKAIAERAIDHVLERLDAVGSRALEVLSSIAAHPAAASRRERIVAELRSRMPLPEGDEAFVEGQVALLTLQSESEATISIGALMERAAAIDDEGDRSRIFAWIAARMSGPCAKRRFAQPLMPLRRSTMTASPDPARRR